MKLVCSLILIVTLVIVHNATSSNVFCSHEFAAAVVRACVRMRTARAPDTDTADSVFGT